MSIDPASPLFAQIRAHALAFRRKGSGPTLAGSAAHGRASEPRDWLADVAHRVAGIEPEDPHRQRKAFRVYLRAALARELGIHRPDEPGFPQLVDKVLETMESDPQLKEAITTAGAMLLRLAAK